MLNEIEDFLSRKLLPEIFGDYQTCNRLFERINYQGFTTKAEEVLQQVESIGEQLTLVELLHLYETSVTMLLVNHGIFVSTESEIRFDKIYQILEAVIDLSTSTDAELIMEVLESEQDNVEKLSDIIELTSDLEAVKIYDIVYEVDGAFLDKLGELVTDKVSHVDLTLTDDTKSISRNRFKTHAVSEASTATRQFLMDGGSFGLPLSALLLVLEDSIVEQTPNLMLTDIVSMVLISNTPDHLLNETVLAVIQQVTAEQSVASDLMLRVGSFLL